MLKRLSPSLTPIYRMILMVKMPFEQEFAIVQTKGQLLGLSIPSHNSLGTKCEEIDISETGYW